MAIAVLKNVRIFAGAVDITGRTNKVELSAEVEEKDATTFADVDANGDVWKAVRGGIDTGKLSASGLHDPDVGSVDALAWSQLGTASAWTICPTGVAVGDLAYLTSLANSAYKALGQTGDIAPWEASSGTATPIARGKVLNPPGTARTATGTGTAVDNGVGWPSGRNLWASLHVLSVSGTAPSMTVRIETDDNVGFTTPATRVTFNAATTTGSQILANNTNFTDQYVRAAWTISGTTPSFLAMVAVGTAIM